jgi:hypothetical protein
VESAVQKQVNTKIQSHFLLKPMPFRFQSKEGKLPIMWLLVLLEERRNAKNSKSDSLIKLQIATVTGEQI